MTTEGRVKKEIPAAWLAVAIIILGIIAYGNALSGQFVWDDTLLILQNEHIKSPAFI